MIRPLLLHVRCLLVAAAIAGSCCTAHSQQPQTTTPAPAEIEPKADALLRQMCDALASAKQFTFEANILTDEVTATGQKIQFAKTVQPSIRRPDRIAADVKGDLQNYHFVYDGASVSLADPRSGEFSVIPSAPGTIDATLDFLANKYGIVTPLADLLFSNPYESFVRRCQAGVYVGEHSVNGTPTHHLAFRADAVDWQLWIDATPGAKPLPRKLVISYKQLPAEPQFIAVFDKWDLNAKVPDEAFKFTPPAGAKRVELTPATTQPAQGRP
jgi:hypothetical protein